MKLMPLALAIALLSPAVAAAQTAPLIRDIASGSHFTLVVKADGTVVGWGRDPDGQAARPVSGSAGKAGNLFDVSQVLAWLAKERRDVQEQVEWRAQIPGLMAGLELRARSA